MIGIRFTFIDIAFASHPVPKPVDCSRFISYCQKWIPTFKKGFSGDEFLSEYMRRVGGEVQLINTIRFQEWAGSITFLEDNLNGNFQPCEVYISNV